MKPASTGEPRRDTVPGHHALNRFHLELIFAAIVFLVGAVGLAGASGLNTGWSAGGPQAGYFPSRVALILMAAALLVVLQAWLDRRALVRVQVTDGPGLRRVLGLGLPMIGLVALAQWLGIYVSMALYLLFTIRFLGRRGWGTSLSVAIGVVVITFVVFEFWFKVPLLKGPLEVMLRLG